MADTPEIPEVSGPFERRVAILSKWRLFWFIGMALGALGAAVGGSAFLM